MLEKTKMPDAEVVSFFENTISEIQVHLEVLHENLKMATNQMQIAENHKLNTCFKKLCALDKNGSNNQSKQIDVLIEEIKRLRTENQDTKDDLSIANSKLEKYKTKYFQAIKETQSCLQDIKKIKTEGDRVRAKMEADLKLQRESHDKQLKQQQASLLLLDAKKAELEMEKQKRKIVEIDFAQQTNILTETRTRCDNALRELEKQDILVIHLKSSIDNLKMDLNKSKENNDALKAQIEAKSEAELKLQDQEKQLSKKDYEIDALTQQLKISQEESARELTRIKDRAVQQRQLSQEHIIELEKKIVELKCEKETVMQDKDAVYNKVQEEIEKLDKKFSEAKSEMKELKNNAQLLKEAPNSNILHLECMDLYPRDSVA